MSGSVTIRSRYGGRKIKLLSGEINKAKLQVGYFTTTPDYPDGTSVADVATWQEYGTDTIPERPFMRTTMTQNRDEYFRLMRSMLISIIRGRASSQRSIATVALRIKNDIQDSIIRWMTPPNAFSTEDKKGFNDPLVDTEHMLENVEWRISR